MPSEHQRPHQQQQQQPRQQHQQRNPDMVESCDDHADVDLIVRKMMVTTRLDMPSSAGQHNKWVKKSEHLEFEFVLKPNSAATNAAAASTSTDTLRQEDALRNIKLNNNNNKNKQSSLSSSSSLFRRSVRSLRHMLELLVHGRESSSEHHRRDSVRCLFCGFGCCIHVHNQTQAAPRLGTTSRKSAPVLAPVTKPSRKNQRSLISSRRRRNPKMLHHHHPHPHHHHSQHHHQHPINSPASLGGQYNSPYMNVCEMKATTRTSSHHITTTCERQKALAFALDSVAGGDHRCISSMRASEQNQTNKNNHKQQSERDANVELERRQSLAVSLKKALGLRVESPSHSPSLLSSARRNTKTNAKTPAGTAAAVAHSKKIRSARSAQPNITSIRVLRPSNDLTLCRFDSDFNIIPDFNGLIKSN